MRKLMQIVCGIFVVCAAQTALACDYPTRVSIPDGATATKEEMLASKKAVLEFQSRMEEYRNCIEEAEKSARASMDDMEPEIEQQREEMLTKKYNAAVEEEENVVAAFNQAIGDYKAANQ